MSPTTTQPAPEGRVGTRRARDAPRVTLAVSLALTAVTAPVFFTGALSTRMRVDFGGAGAAVAITAFFVGAGLSAVPMGWVTERVGARSALRGGVAMAAVGDLALAGLAGSWWHASIILFLAGTAVGLVDTGSARSFTDAVPAVRHGLAFGVKEASVPAASLLAGLSIPLLATQLGWRSAFVAAVVLTPLVWVLVPADRPPAVEPPDAPGRAVRRGPLTLFATGVALGTGAATAAATLFVPAFAARGWGESSAGVLLAAVSAASVGTRLVLGWLTDRRPGSSWHVMGSLMVLGAAGGAALSWPGGGLLAVLGALLVIGAGWGWTGLAFQTAVRVSPGAPALAAGIVLAGLSVGGAGGPAAFGAISAGAGYDAAWAAAAGAFVVGATAVVTARFWIERRPATR